MQQGAMGSITPYVTSAFAAHSLTPTVSIFSNIIGGVFQLSLAKILDVFGRPQGYLLSVFFATIGLIMMAACNNVETYAAAQVFYTVGNNAILYCVSVFVADTSSLRNRAMMTAFSASPNLITIWLAGPISEAFLNGPGWRWGFGTFCILVPLFTLPLYGLFVYNFKKAKNQGLIPSPTVKGQPGSLSSTTAASLMLLVSFCYLLVSLYFSCPSTSTTSKMKDGVPLLLSPYLLLALLSLLHLLCGRNSSPPLLLFPILSSWIAPSLAPVFSAPRSLSVTIAG
ncbi:siderophore iron transporter mirb [Ilyonectria robusta]